MAGEDYTPPGGSHIFTVPKYDEAADAPQAFKDFAASIDGGIGSGIDFPSEREGQVIQGDGGQGWVTGSVMRVVQDLPADDDPDYVENDIVFVLGDVPKGGGGSPAAISAENGASVERGKVIGDKTYDIYTFTDDTATDLSLTVAPDGAGYVDALLVGGGGAGNLTSNNLTGGGGAGDFVELSVYLDSGKHDITVGSGGISQTYTIDQTDNGSPSKLGLVALAMGGGAGAGSHPTPGTVNDFSNPGASSGGATGGTVYEAGKALGLCGNQGAVTGTVASAGGGGGGAGGPGGQASAGAGGSGGEGKSSMITGSERWFAAGGGGAGSPTSGVGGSGIGGTGAGNGSASATPPEANSGSGGGGSNAPGGGGNGAAGIVIVRVEV